MKRYTFDFAPREEGQTTRCRPRELTFGVKDDSRVLLAPSTWDFIAEQQLGLATLATLAITSAALKVGGRDIVGIYFDQEAAPVLRAEIFGGLDRSVRGKLFLRGRLYVGAAESPITSAQPLAVTAGMWRTISSVSHVMAAQLFCEFHAAQRAGLAERAGVP